MNDFNLMLAEYGIYVINQENGKFVFFAYDSSDFYEALTKWEDGAKKGIYPPLVQGSFLIARMTEPKHVLNVYVLCREVPGYVSNNDIMKWKNGDIMIPNEVLLAILQNQIKNAVDVAKYKEVITDATGNVISTDVQDELPNPKNFILKSKKYSGIVFYANYFSKTGGSIIYRFSSGIILDSSSGTPQYKIVFASYDVKAAKVTFVEKVLP